MITQEQKDILNEYAAIKKDIKFLEDKADALNPQVLDIMQVNDLGEVAISDIGKLSISSRRTWKYTQKTKELEQALKEEKAFEEQTGKADYSEKHFILFKRYE